MSPERWQISSGKEDGRSFFHQGGEVQKNLWIHDFPLTHCSLKLPDELGILMKEGHKLRPVIVHVPAKFRTGSKYCEHAANYLGISRLMYICTSSSARRRSSGEPRVLFCPLSDIYPFSFLVRFFLANNMF